MAALATIVATLSALSLLLVLTDVVERKVISEPVLIAKLVKARGISPDYVEAFVVSAAEKVLGQREEDS
jgi:hypothetical protein